MIAVANLDEEKQQINATSSQGPTRDGRSKPEIAAPGTRRRSRPMASARPSETVDRHDRHQHGQPVRGRRRRPDAGREPRSSPRRSAWASCSAHRARSPGASYKWVNDVGFGRIDPEAALEEARRSTPASSSLGGRR